MRTTDGFPAPDRDMALVEPRVPPASREMSPLTRTVAGMLGIALGLGVALLGLVGVIGEDGPARRAAALMLAAGVCFLLAGVGLSRRTATVLPLACVVLGVLLGVSAQLVG